MLNTIVDRGSKQHISFVQGARCTSVQAFGDHIRSIAEQHDNVPAKSFLSTPDPQRDLHGIHYHYSGRVRLDALDRSEDLYMHDKNATYFVCGPEGFMNAIQKQLVDLGVHPEKVKMEVFGAGELAHD